TSISRSMAAIGPSATPSHTSGGCGPLTNSLAPAKPLDSPTSRSGATRGTPPKALPASSSAPSPRRPSRDWTSGRPMSSLRPDILPAPPHRYAHYEPAPPTLSTGGRTAHSPTITHADNNLPHPLQSR